MKEAIVIFFVFISLLGCNKKENVGEIYSKLKKNSHDLNLPKWGPYTKKYIGLSHIPKVEEGIRIDFSVFPGILNKKTKAPNVFKKTGFHPWEASPNLEYFSFRHELKWKDKLYTDISYSKIDSNSRSIRIECVNNTSLQESLVLHLLASIHFPPLKPHNPELKIDYNTIKLPENSFWVDALDYQSFEYAKTKHRNDLAYDGMLRGEVRDHGLVNGSGIGKGFGKNIGDQVDYEFEIPKEIKNAILCLRYKTETKQNAKLKIKGIVNKTINLESSEEFKFIKVSLGNLKQEKHQLLIESKSKTPLIIDGYVIVAEKEFDLIKINTIKWNNIPEINEGPIPNTYILKYDNIDKYYGIYLNHPNIKHRDWVLKDLPDEYNIEVINPEKSKFFIDSKGYFTDVFIEPVIVEPNTTKIIDGMVCTGAKKEVISRLEKSNQINYTEIYNKSKENLPDYNTVPAGKKYEFSQKLMAANTISNVVYPVYTQNEYIKHHAPGRKWDCLYTWDSGFIGIGLSQLSIQRGVENLNAYLNEPGEQSAFIHHGTPLPVQFYLFLELWNKTQSDELVITNYPKLKRYYDFLIGNTSTSTTRNLNSGLLRTWDYFYNSGGWDDYPAQKYVHNNKLAKNVTPVISTSHMIRVAKILQMSAVHLDLMEDYNEYENDIKELSGALHDYSWDEESGYFGYVVHNKLGNPKGILKYNDSINFNMGLGGASPLISGICNENQANKILSHLKNKGEIWSDIGLSTIDQRAPYYYKKGYWNGHVWMPHQWFFWKSMLDEGEADFAYKIAKTALDLWKQETENSYNCYEYFSIETGKGKGWHQFSGLSSPVLSWFNAYYQIGNITTGYDVWIEKKEFNEDYSGLNSTVKIFNHKNKPFSIIVCLNPEFAYDVFWNDKEVDFKEFNKGTLSITINENTNIGNLKINKK